MRCPTCGTENTPDSRFCGGCGAKLVPEVSRVAPTAKISDDAAFPLQRYPTPVPAQPYASGPASIPPANGPATIPPAANAYPGPASIPPNTYRANAAFTPREASLSMPVVARARWGLIAVVLVLDLGLAAAGAVMLQKGLARPEPGPASDGSAHAALPPARPTLLLTAGSGPALSPETSERLANAASAGTGSNAVAATGSNTAPAPRAPKPTKSDTKPEPRPVVQAKKAPPQHDVKNELGVEIELAAARSRGDFDKCYADASPEIHLKGRIDIAFTVLPDGRIDRPHVAQNETGSQQLASCLTATIARWAFTSHPAEPVLISRPFIFN
ncbi:MAG: AgmX/PglI C-terminal domain-containing protein [Kofleriaceae bacterium]